jgi:hypothetical protein
MNESNQGTSVLRQRMIEDMRMRKLSPKTQATYIRSVRRFAAHLGRSPDTATVEELRAYQLHLVDQGTSPITLNATITGLKFFFDVTLDRGELMAKMKPVFVPRTVPVVLSREEVVRLISACRNLKRQTALSSRPSRALSTSVALRVHRSQHDRHRINQQNFPGGICLNNTVANSHCLVLQVAPTAPPQSPLERPVPLRTWHATDTHRSRNPDYLRLIGACRRSNPHSSADLLIGISTSPRFPPSALARRLPSHLSAHASTRVHGQTTSNP